MPRPTIVKFYLEHNEDEEITCFVCRRARCELSFIVFGPDDITEKGAHIECVEHHDQRQHKKLEQAKKAPED